ncbi:MAG: tRNA (adenosine(37)-N6)-threonylcarbamoyltransferase complex ATPase subunit type 1 TsaE [Nitrospirae bacterium]|nr:tRNA (adenosine(37)-N6)-threonylcarbamoyltransferase complex ATPase subunit type 1 TsaE [Nitrospirota bacterium]
MELHHLRLSSPNDTLTLGERIGAILQGGEIIALIGDLGVGKTLFTRGVVSGAGISSDQVHSPTFTFIQEYKGPISIIHVDLYRIKNPEELHSLGLEEYFSPQSAMLIEWADRAMAQLPQDFLSLTLTHTGPTHRQATFDANGPESAAFLSKIVNTSFPP